MTVPRNHFNPIVPGARVPGSRLTVIRLSPNPRLPGRVYWDCLCDCGNTHTVYDYSLKSGERAVVWVLATGVDGTGGKGRVAGDGEMTMAAPDDLYLADVLLLCVDCRQPIKARINTQQWIRVEWIGPSGECQVCWNRAKERKCDESSTC